MTFNFRDATLNDLQQIVRIYNEAIEEGGFTADLEPFTIQEKEAWFNEVSLLPYFIQVVEIEKEVVGYFYIAPWRKGRKALSKTAEISLYLKKSFRTKGLGKQMLTKAVYLAKRNGLEHLMAILLDINQRSEQLLLSQDFIKAGHLSNIANINSDRCGQLIYIKKL